MHAKVEVLIDDTLSRLFVNCHIRHRAEWWLPVCQLLKGLGLANVIVRIDEKDPDKIDLYYHRTEQLEDILLTHREGLKKPLGDDSEDNNDDNNDNDNDNEERVTKSRKKHTRLKAAKS